MRCGCPLIFARFFRGATSSRTPEARGSGYAAPNAEANAADEGMDLTNGQPVPANGDRVSRWPDEPARQRIASRATSRIADAQPAPHRLLVLPHDRGPDQATMAASRIVCGPGAAPIGRRVVEVIQLSQLFLADPVQPHRPHRSLQLHGSSGLSNSSEIQSCRGFKRLLRK